MVVVAPNPNSSRRPKFNAADPGAYPAGAWSRYDRIVQEAQKLGLQVYFMLTPPAPTWAVPRGDKTGQGERLGQAPKSSELRSFAEAAGRRYGGSYGGLPRVSFWSIWNEPNFPAWLNPLHRSLRTGGQELLEPPLYRRIVNAGWSGLQASGHTPATDTILIGETSNSGVEAPGDFVRDLYCVDSGLRPLTGTAARQFGCPTSGSRTGFVNSDPGLFEASGFAHHPYSFNVPPNRAYPLSTRYTLHNMGSLEGLLSGIFATYGKQRSGGVPLYLTEFGYESNPPNPFVQNSTTQQAAWLNESEYMAWKDPDVVLLNQFELIDSRPRAHTQPGSRAYWGTFQTGLEFVGGKPKPALAAFRLPIWLPVARHGQSVSVWGQLRLARHATTQHGLIEYERRGSHTWSHSSADVVSTNNTEGFFFAHVPIPSAGAVRLVWLDPSSGLTYFSRVTSVS